MSVLVSIVVPTYRRPDLLDRCMAALMRQDFDPSTYEIIVADDAESPDTLIQVTEWAEKVISYTIWPAPRASVQLPSDGMETSQQPHTQSQGEFVTIANGPLVRYLAVQGEHGPAAARNAGWRAAQGEIIAFTDDDTVPDIHWLKAGVSKFSQGVVGVTGKILMPLPDEPTDYELDASGLERSEFVTANCFYLRSALEVIGGFDTQFKMAWREDTDFYFTLREKGAMLMPAPDSVVWHPIRPAPWGISLRQQRKSMFNALLYKKHPALYRSELQPRPPWHYYLTIVGAITALIGFLLESIWVWAPGLGLWLGASLWFLNRRVQGTTHRPEHLFEMAVTSLLIPWMSVYWRLRGALTYHVWFL